MGNPADLSAFTVDELVAEVKRRRHGIDINKVNDIDSTLEGLNLGELGVLRRRVNAVWEYRLGCEWKGLTDDEKLLLANRDFIACVKAVRARMGLGLADAKELMDKERGK